MTSFPQIHLVLKVHRKMWAVLENSRFLLFFMHSFRDSLLLGKTQVALLKLLISDVEANLSNGYFPPHLSIFCNFLALLHFLLGLLHLIYAPSLLMSLLNHFLTMLKTKKLLWSFGRALNPLNLDRNTASNPKKSCPSCQDNQRAGKRIKKKCALAKKHGIGKGLTLMTLAKKHGVGKGDISTGNGYTDREVVVFPISTSIAPKNHYIGRKDHDKLLWL
ncbi:hypothetical protein CFP56_001247 [Quercus suber]|uniref:Uncharacterized protein n=1 Tax=Quercus suber TaxID=58331 RepID=A0AAW0IN91_QUESU